MNAATDHEPAAAALPAEPAGLPRLLLLLPWPGWLPTPAATPAAACMLASSWAWATMAAGLLPGLFAASDLSPTTHTTLDPAGMCNTAAVAVPPAAPPLPTPCVLLLHPPAARPVPSVRGEAVLSPRVHRLLAPLWKAELSLSHTPNCRTKPSGKVSAPLCCGRCCCWWWWCCSCGCNCCWWWFTGTTA
ncbi:hypothetical protein COO60DRAFT_1518562 [Scenedesmus sp. NREL 46B-D3]|nr:hypothetical protein COO60DRAFT_1518562 [Scenedesmus sp. NREL 46B-D3]